MIEKTEIVLRASSAARYAACPASYFRERGLPDRDVAPEIRAAGVRAHAYCAAVLRGVEDPQIEGLTDEERYTADYLIGRARGIFAEHGNATQWLMLDDTTPLTGLGWSGHPDAVALAGDGSIHIFDWKFGWLDVPDADMNLQLRVYAVMLAYLKSPKNLYGHIVGRTGTTSTLYGPADIADAISEINQIALNVVRAEHARGNHGDSQCRYCRAFLTARCPETCALVPAAAKTLPSVAQIAALPAADVARSLPLIGMVKAAFAALEARAKALLAEDADAFGGVWKLEAGNTRREITDSATAYTRTGKLMREADFLSACKVSRAALIDTLTDWLVTKAKANGEKLTKKDAKVTATAQLDAALGDCVETKQNAPSLKFFGETKQITGETK